MKFIKLSFESYPVKFYNRTHKVTNILKLNGIGLKNSNEEEIINYFKKFDLNCMAYLIANQDIVYLEFYKKKDCQSLFNFFNNNKGNGNTLNNNDIVAEYANMKYEINNSSNIYTENYSRILKNNEDIHIYENVIDKKTSDEIIQNYENPQWLKYTKNKELNICHYFCRTIPNKIYKSYCIQNLTSFFSSEFIEKIKGIFNGKEPNQVSIFHCHIKKSIEYVIESSFIFEDEIAFLTLGNDIPISFFDLRNRSKINLMLSSNTLLKIKGKSRYELIFGIPKKKSIQLEDKVRDRKNSYLIIFRFLKENNLENILTQKKKNEKNKTEKQEKNCVSIDLNDFVSENLEKKYVLDVYNKIAQHFDHTRYKTWKNVENLINEEKEGNMIIDIGCGSGKHLNVSSKYFFIGLDFSLYLLKIAQKKKNTDLFLANCVNVPLRSNLADLCISIAVIHHIGTHEKRKKAIEEMVRCTKIGGRILIYVWAYEQKDNIIGNRQFDSQDIFVPWYLQQQYTTKTSEEEHFNSNPLKKDLLKLQRYYHVFKKEEIYELCESVNGVKVEKIYFDCNNWGIILKKVF